MVSNRTWGEREKCVDLGSLHPPSRLWAAGPGGTEIIQAEW